MKKDQHLPRHQLQQTSHLYSSSFYVITANMKTKCMQRIGDRKSKGIWLISLQRTGLICYEWERGEGEEHASSRLKIAWYRKRYLWILTIIVLAGLSDTRYVWYNMVQKFWMTAELSIVCYLQFDQHTENVYLGSDHTQNNTKNSLFHFFYKSV